ncbi:MAG: DUF169 domain-containing protein [Nitrososphaerota archaeon]|nr:DUF169 domain-containing protein [Candidatus Bathyarchaeota archaeon]MDW8023557.1 DUF169 domain-containing protein [Nitrososphaerota archaeon]
MEPKNDLSVFQKLNFLKPPVGVKFLFFKPEGMKPLPLERRLSFCELLVEAQDSEEPFYFSRENHETCVGKFLLGMEETASFAESGQIGPKLGIFQEPRANYVFYQHIPRFERNVVNYVAFSKLDKVPFDPDVLIINATAPQAEIVMRAVAYSTGELYVSKTTPVMGCAWIYIYPFRKKKVNFIIPEMVHGMKSRRLFQEGSILISIPYNWLPIVTRNLKTMEMELPSYRSKEQYLEEFQKILEALAKKAANP